MKTKIAIAIVLLVIIGGGAFATWGTVSPTMTKVCAQVGADRDTFASDWFPINSSGFETKGIWVSVIVPNATSIDNSVVGEGTTDTATVYVYGRGLGGGALKAADTARGFPPCTLNVYVDDNEIIYSDGFRIDFVCADSSGASAQADSALTRTVTYRYKLNTNYKINPDGSKGGE